MHLRNYNNKFKNILFEILMIFLINNSLNMNSYNIT